MIVELRTDMTTHKFTGFSASNGRHYLADELRGWSEAEPERALLIDRLLQRGCRLVSTVACPSVINAEGQLIDTFFLEEDGEDDDQGEFVALRSKLAHDLPFRPGQED